MTVLNVCLEVSHQIDASDQSKFSSQVSTDLWMIILKLTPFIYIVV